MAKGYIIAEVTVNNPAAYEEYKKLTPISLKQYQGKFIVRGGQATSLEGGWQPQRVVVLEFPSIKLAKDWWASEEYAPAKEIRQKHASTKMIAIEGFDM